MQTTLALDLEPQVPRRPRNNGRRPGARRACRQLTAKELASAKAALSVLTGTGLSLEDAARRAVNCSVVLQSIGFTPAVDAFVLKTIRAGRSRATVNWYDLWLRPMADAFGTRPLDGITRADLREVIVALWPTLPARANAGRAARGLWRWAVQHEPAFAVADLTQGLNFTTGPKSSNPTGAAAQPCSL